MVRAQFFLMDSQGALKEGFGLGVAALAVVQQRQIVEGGGR